MSHSKVLRTTAPAPMALTITLFLSGALIGSSLPARVPQGPGRVHDR
jgi:hypothetical protein